MESGKIIHGLGAVSCLVKARIFRRQIPFLLYFLITERCNLVCPYCWIRRSPDVDANELSTDSVIKIIDDFYQWGTRYICFLGGEPLLRQDLDVIISHANKRGIINDIVTNGLLIPRQLAALKKCNVVGISLEGDEEAHDHDRGKGTYARILENIELLRANGIRLRFHVTVTQNTIHAFRHVAEIAKKYHARIVVSVVLMSAGKENEAIPDVETLREFWREVKAFKKAGYPIDKSYSALDCLIKNAHLLRDGRRQNDVPSIPGVTSCQYGRYACYLGADGTIFPCCHSDIYGKVDLDSNVVKLGVKKAWENVVRNTPCRFCSMMIGCEINNFLNLNGPAIGEAVSTHVFRSRP